jgi:hypothetical protein
MNPLRKVVKQNKATDYPPEADDITSLSSQIFKKLNL